jgi:hypothetical protein
MLALAGQDLEGRDHSPYGADTGGSTAGQEGFAPSPDAGVADVPADVSRNAWAKVDAASTKSAAAVEVSASGSPFMS